MTAKGTSTFGMDQDDVVMMPYTTFVRRVSGDDRIGMVMVSAVSEARTDEAKEQIEALMRQRRHILPGEDDDFNVRDMRELQSLMGTVTGVLTTLLASVAAISLIVGGIGIMNIMLVSVTERTREIGIRLAIGAQERDVLMQFLTEAMILSTLGGLVGIALGLMLALLGVGLIGAPFLPSIGVIVGATLFSAAFGIAFGFFPARRAAKLNPIDALRYE